MPFSSFFSSKLRFRFFTLRPSSLGLFGSYSKRPTRGGKKKGDSEIKKKKNAAKMHVSLRNCFFNACIFAVK